MHLPAAIVQLLFAIQLPVCLYVGFRTARRTGRAVLNWLVYGFLTAIVFPPLGATIALIIFFACPPARRGETPRVTPLRAVRATLPDGRGRSRVRGADATAGRSTSCPRPSPRRSTRRSEAPPLAELARGARSVAVVVPDATRDCPVSTLLPPVLDRLAQAGLRDEQVCVVVGCGLHRTTTPDEKAALVGAPVAARVRVVDAQGISQTSVTLGAAARGGAISMNARRGPSRPRGRPGHRRTPPLRRLLGRRQGGGDRLRRTGDDRLDAPPRVPRPARRASLPARRQPLSGGAARDRGGHRSAVCVERRAERRRRGRRPCGRRPRRRPATACQRPRRGLDKATRTAVRPRRRRRAGAQGPQPLPGVAGGHLRGPRRPSRGRRRRPRSSVAPTCRWASATAPARPTSARCWPRPSGPSTSWRAAASSPSAPVGNAPT